MINEIFKGCIEQNFEILIDDNNNTSNINIRNNLNFMEKQFLYCIKEIILNNINKINTNNEINEKEIMIGCIGLYALYRQLLPSNQYPDPKLYKIVWGIQKTIPFVIICETVMWNVGKFIFILYLLHYILYDIVYSVILYILYYILPTTISLLYFLLPYSLLLLLLYPNTATTL